MDSIFKQKYRLQKKEIKAKIHEIKKDKALILAVRGIPAVAGTIVLSTAILVKDIIPMPAIWYALGTGLVLSSPSGFAIYKKRNKEQIENRKKSLTRLKRILKEIKNSESEEIKRKKKH